MGTPYVAGLVDWTGPAFGSRGVLSFSSYCGLLDQEGRAALRGHIVTYGAARWQPALRGHIIIYCAARWRRDLRGHIIFYQAAWLHTALRGHVFFYSAQVGTHEC